MTLLLELNYKSLVEHIYMFVCMCVFASDNINTYKYKQLLQNKEFENFDLSLRHFVSCAA